MILLAILLIVQIRLLLDGQFAKLSPAWNGGWAGRGKAYRVTVNKRQAEDWIEDTICHPSSR